MTRDYQYAYGMTQRGFAPLCQPKGVVDWQDFDKPTNVWGGESPVLSIIYYAKPLSEKEIREYELIRLPNYDREPVTYDTVLYG